MNTLAHSLVHILWLILTTPISQVLIAILFIFGASVGLVCFAHYIGNAAVKEHQYELLEGQRLLASSEHTYCTPLDNDLYLLRPL